VEERVASIAANALIGDSKTIAPTPTTTTQMSRLLIPRQH
jgi:hypothetical protein